MLARERGDQGAFIREFLGEHGLMMKNPATILYILLTGVIMRSGRLIYGCENCGRIWVQKHAEYGKNFFACSSPEGETRGVLRSRHRKKNDTKPSS
jgi:hypothetical protein